MSPVINIRSDYICPKCKAPWPWSYKQDQPALKCSNCGFDLAPAPAQSREEEALTPRGAIDHPLLRQLFGAIEDSGTPEAARLWTICQSWFEVRDAALRSRQSPQADHRDALILEANDVLRSAYSIAERKGEQVSSWEGFRNRIKRALDNQHLLVKSLLEDTSRCPECPAPEDINCEGCAPLEDAAPRPSPQGEDVEMALCSLMAAIDCLVSRMSGTNDDRAGIAMNAHKTIAVLRARLVSAQSSAQGEEAREMREALYQKARGKMYNSSKGKAITEFDLYDVLFSDIEGEYHD